MKPATPLPWHSAEIETPLGDRLGNAYKLTRGENEIAIFRADGSRTQEGDARYAAHAANAYPRLVEALKKVIGVYQDASDAPLYAIRAKKLLRELGELT